jgi:hypothetical protein
MLSTACICSICKDLMFDVAGECSVVNSKIVSYILFTFIIYQLSAYIL